MSDDSLSLVNAFEVELDGETRHVLCFLEPALADAQGLDPRSIIGELDPDSDGYFDPADLRLNPEFVASVTGYMNAQAERLPTQPARAANLESDSLYVLDPRYTGAPDDAPQSEVLGAFIVDDAGMIAPGSFRYNRHHVWFEPTYGVSGLLEDRRFYEWLHPASG